MPRRFLLTGGGTGGHVTPALATAGALAERYPDAEFRYVGLGDKAEGVMVPKAGLPLSRVTSRGFPPPGPGFLSFAWHLGWGVLAALGILLRHRPHLIIATGGYVAAPVVLANALLRRLRLSRAPLLVHEQNSHLGRLNRVAAGVADLVAVSFPETLQELPPGKGVYVGYPVRANLRAGDRGQARRKLGIPENARVIFAFGGSQGARTINRAVADAAATLLAHPDVWLLHGCGKPFGGASRRQYHGHDDVVARLQEQAPDLLEHPRYRREAFIDDMATWYGASDLVICRAGAGSLMEVCTQGRPSLVIPKANLPGDHQVRNARLLERAGACRVLYERMDPDAGPGAVPYVPGLRLAGLVQQLLDDPGQRARMGEAAASLITTDARELLADCAVFLLGEGDRPAAAAPPRYPSDRVLGLGAGAMERLLQDVAHESAPPLDAAERELLLSKVDGLLASTAWIDRARGCRIAGLASYREAAPLLKDRATRDLPMVRRDALKGLRGLGPRSLPPAEFAGLLRHGLDDDYYEARAEAALTTAACNGLLEPDARVGLSAVLARLCRDHSFEVRMAAVRALGRIADAPEPAISALRRVHFDPVWKVRGALFEAYAELTERGVLTAAEANAEIEAILITANGYLTEYQIRHRRNDAVRRVRRREA